MLRKEGHSMMHAGLEIPRQEREGSLNAPRPTHLASTQLTPFHVIYHFSMLAA
jgi:hypothetical protein